MTETENVNANKLEIRTYEELNAPFSVDVLFKLDLLIVC